MPRASLTALLLAFTVLTGPWPAAAVQVEAIPSPRPAGWAVDLTGTVAPDTLREIDHLGDEIKAAHGAEIAVVLVDTTEGVPSREFATRLFNHWRIGEQGVDNGLLIFAALSDRRAEIVLGSGIDHPASQATSAEIMQGEIVPRFKSGDPGGALLAGTRSCALRILNVPVAEAQPVAIAPPFRIWGEDVSDVLGPGALLGAVLVILAYFIKQPRRLSSGISKSAGSSSLQLSDTVEEQLRRSSGFVSPPISIESSNSTSNDSGYSGGHSSGGGDSGSW